MDELEKLTVVELQNILRERGLPVGYKKKRDLINRLKSVKDNIGEETDTSESDSQKYVFESESEEGFDKPVGLETRAENLVEEVSSMPGENETIPNNNNNNFVFKDIEESLEVFNGESRKNVVSWLKDFEDIAKICNWNDVQKYLYARRLLRGAAKLAIEASTGIRSWGDLKTTLTKEFGDAPTSLSIHRSLESRKKEPSETLLEYLYAMKQIANRGSVDEESLVAYVVAGIPDHVQNKMVLYEAKTVDELKQKFKVYEAMKADQKSQISTKKVPRTENARDKPSQSVRRCFNCGSRTHLTHSCPHRSRGSRCFNCGDFGHQANNCPQPRGQRPFASGNDGTRNQVNTISTLDLTVVARFGRGEYRALVDTGSEVTLLRESVAMCAIDAHLEKGPSIILTGFGQNLKRTLGSILAILNINGDDYKVRCHIVPDSWITQDILIGVNVLKDAKLIIEEGKMTISKTRVVESEEEPDFLQKLDVVQLVEEFKLDSLEEIENTEYREVVRDIIAEYTPQKPKESCVKMEIRLEGETSVYSKPRRLAQKEKEAVSEQIKDWLEEGIIRPSSSNFASPVVLAKKRDGSLRLCIDFRRLNRYIIKDRYPLPVMEDILEDLHQAVVFTTLDLRNGFFHVDIEESSRKFTAFLTADGQFEFNKAPFGLCNSPAVFQRFINTVFQPLIRDKTLLVYMDDIIIPSSDEAENLEKLKRTLNVAAEHGLRIKWSKCKFLKRSVEFLGHIVEQGSIKPSKDKVAAIQKFPTPRDVKSVQCFLGLTGFFRKFIQGYSTIAKPLSDLIKKNVPFRFEQRQQDAFNLLKERLCSAPVLKLFNPQLETELHTDACKAGYGAVLLQKHTDTGKFHPVFYISFKTTDAEQRYSSYELEVLAIVKSLKKLRHYLLGLKFSVYTDCKAFELTMRKKEISSRVARWALLLEEFDCRVHHRSGSAMRHVDALSRYPAVFSIEGDVLQQVKRAQEEDNFCRLVKKCLQQGEYEDFLLRNNVLYKFADGNYLLVVPKAMQRAIIKNVHERGHISSRKVETLVRQEYFIPKLAEKIQSVMENCVACILASRKMGKPEGILNPIEKIDQPLHTYHVDHLGPLASTAKNYRYLFVVIDAFTKFSWIYPVKSTTTDEAIRKLELQSEIFGNPHRIIMDRGTAFTSTAFKSYCEERKISQVFITTGVPRGNGQVERLNQIIINVLSRISIADPTKWYKHVPHLQRILNSTYSRSTGRTPFQLMFGVKMSYLEQQELAKAVEEEIVSVFENERDVLRKEAKQQIEKVQEENRRYSRRRRKPARKYKVGDLVAIKRTQFAPGAKLFPKFLGPYEVTAVRTNDRYDVKKVGNHEGPNYSSSAADFMKPWSSLDGEIDASETDEDQDGRMWEQNS